MSRSDGERCARRARRSRLIGAFAGSVIVAGLSGHPARALEQPEPLTAADLQIGTDMTPIETEEARQFCQDTLGRAAQTVDSIGRACACFPTAWGARTNRLHRMVLPITLAPDAPESRENLAKILRAQDGIHDDRLRQLALEYQAAAKQAFRACR